MIPARDSIHGPWPAVPVPGVPPILSAGTIVYPPVSIAALIAQDHPSRSAFSWRATYLIYGGVRACISAPVHAFLLPRDRAVVDVPKADDVKVPDKVLPPHGLPFILVASAFTAYAFVPSGLAAHLLAIFARSGIDSGTVVWIGALFGPAQVGARLIEFSFGRNLHPLWLIRFALSVL